MASPTPNKGYTYPAHGGAVNAWDTPLNTNFDQIDLNVAGPYPLTITSTSAAITYNSSFASIGSAATTITPPSSLAQNLYYKYTGTMSNDQDLAFPAAGGLYIINNGSSGAFALTAVVSGSTAVSVPIPQGGTNVVVSNGTDMVLANSNVLAKIATFLGDPNGNVAGTAGTANNSATDFEWDGTNFDLFAAIQTGTAATTIWGPVAGKLTPEGYLTVSTDNANPIISANVLSSTTVKYVPYVGNWTLLSNGTTVFPYQFSAMTLTLTAAQAASSYTSGAITTASIYDIFIYHNGGVPVIGTGPAWVAGVGGSGTPGACARGTGAGGTALVRLKGIWVNAAAVTLTNNVTTYACPLQEGVYLGSILIDATAGQVTCHRAWGQSRKFGVWNAYNRVPIVLSAGDSTASWNNDSTSFRVSNTTPANNIAVFNGLPEESVTTQFYEFAAGTKYDTFAIGWNSQTVASGTQTAATTQNPPFYTGFPPAIYALYPTVGVNNVFSLEKVNANFDLAYGTETYMRLISAWRG